MAFRDDESWKKIETRPKKVHFFFFSGRKPKKNIVRVKIKNALLPNAKLGKQNIENVFCHIQPTNYARAIAQRLP